MKLGSKTVAKILATGRPLLLFTFPGKDQVFPLDSLPMSIGRDADCSIAFPDKNLDDRHALIQEGEDGLEFLHLGQSYSSTLAGKAVEACPIQNGDTFRIGEVSFTYINPTADILPPGLQFLALPPQAAMSAASSATLQRPPEDFNEVLLESLKATPWFLISALLHLLIGFSVVLMFQQDPKIPQPPLDIEVDMEDVIESDEEQFEIEEPEDPAEEILSEEEMPEIDESMEDSSSDKPEEEFRDTPTPNIPVEDHRPRGRHGDSGSLNGRGQGRGQNLGKVGGGLRRSIKKLRRSGLDVVFVIDATGSMDGAISSAKRRLGEMISLVGNLDIQFRLGVVAYRDKNEEYVVRSTELTAHHYKALDFLDRVEAGGGGDTPEAVYEALKEATSMRFEPSAKKVLVLVGDAEHHRENEEKMVRMLRAFHANKDGQVNTVLAKSSSSVFDNASVAQKAFELIATAGGGTSVLLRNERKVIRNIAMIALGTKDESDLDTLLFASEDGFRGRVIKRRVVALDTVFVKRMLAKDRLDPLLALNLMRANNDAFLLAYVETLGNRKVPISNRWLATVLMRRLLSDHYANSGQAQTARKLASNFSPEDPRSRQASALRKIRKYLYDAKIALKDKDSKKK